MYQKPTSNDTAKKLPIVQDACLLFSFDLGQEQSIAVEAGKKRFWSNSGDQTLEILVMKSREQT
jgi:hypothetical protein